MDNTRRLLNVERVCKNYNLGSYRKLAEDSLFKHPPAPQYSVFYMDRFIKKRESFDIIRNRLNQDQLIDKITQFAT